MVPGCKQKIAAQLMTYVRNLTLTCYGKQRRHFEFLAIWRTRAVILNFVNIFNFDATVILNFC